MPTRVTAGPSGRLFPDSSARALRRCGRASSGAFLAGVALVTIPLLFALVAFNLHQRDEAAFRSFAARAQDVTGAQLRADPSAFAGTAIHLRGKVVQVVAADEVTELLVAPAVTAGGAGEAVAPAAYDTEPSHVISWSFGGNANVGQGAAMDLWGVGGGTVSVRGQNGTAATYPGVRGEYLQAVKTP